MDWGDAVGGNDAAGEFLNQGIGRLGSFEPGLYYGFESGDARNLLHGCDEFGGGLGGREVQWSSLFARGGDMDRDERARDSGHEADAPIIPVRRDGDAQSGVARADEYGSTAGPHDVHGSIGDDGVLPRGGIEDGEFPECGDRVLKGRRRGEFLVAHLPMVATQAYGRMDNVQNSIAMRITPFFSLFAAAALMAQNPPAAPKPIEAETVVGTSGERKITAGEVSKIMEGLPPQMKQNFSRDVKGFLSQWFMLQQLVGEAEKMKLADKSPYKEGIQMARMQILSQALIEEKSQTTDIPMEEQKKLYEQRKDNFTMAKLKLIYVPFAAGNAAAAAGGKKTLTEQEAQAKAEGLVKQARGGADFVQLVKANSEDPISKEKDGDFGPIRRNDQLPDAIKQAVFALRPGDISEPVRQPNGYYVFRLMELTPQAFEEVQTVLVTELKNVRLKQWLDGAAKSVELKVERPDYFESLK